MKSAGAELVDPAILPSHGKYDEDEEQVLLYEFKSRSERLPSPVSARMSMFDRSPT